MAYNFYNFIVAEHMGIHPMIQSGKQKNIFRLYIKLPFELFNKLYSTIVHLNR